MDPFSAVVWKATYDPFGQATVNEDPDGDGVPVKNNKRYTGMYSDSETGLYYWNSRYYDPKTGRGISADRMSVAAHVRRWQASMGMPGQPPLEINPYAYVANNPLRWTDSTGFYIGFVHEYFTNAGGRMAGLDPTQAQRLAKSVSAVDKGTQQIYNAHMHGMCAAGLSKEICLRNFENYINYQLKKCTEAGLAKAVHAMQDSLAVSHRFQDYSSLLELPISHAFYDIFPTVGEVYYLPYATRDLIQQYQKQCNCGTKQK